METIWYNHARTHHALGGLFVPEDRLTLPCCSSRAPLLVSFGPGDSSLAVAPGEENVPCLHNALRLRCYPRLWVP
jgi:hypothetical protein